jgi:hypothetical protein
MHRLAIVLAKDGDVWLFRTADRAAAWMEALDVRNGEYRLVDCAGAQYVLVASTDDSPVGPRMLGSDDFELLWAAAVSYLKGLPPKRHPPANPDELRTPDEIGHALEPFAG